MRLREYKYILEQSLSYLELPAQHEANSNTFLINNSDEIINSLNLLSETNLFENELKQIRGTNFYLLSEKNKKVSSQEYSIISKNIQSIKNNGNLLLNFLNQILSNSNYTFSVKLPNELNDFEDLEKISKSLKLALSTPVIMLGGNIQFVDFDLGSLWIDIITDCNTIIEFVKYLTEAGIFIWMIRKKNQEVIEHLKSFSLKEESRNEIENAEEEKIKNDLITQTNIVIEKTIKASSKKTNKDGSTIEDSEESQTIIKLKNLTHEDKEFIKNGIKEIADLLSKGVDIVPALQIDSINKEALKDFPDTTKIDYSIKKELPENTKTSN